VRYVALVGSIVLLATAAGAHASGDGFRDGFRTPSGNIVCAYSPGAIRCDIGSGLRPRPRRPRGCDVDYGQGLTVTGRGRASIVCAGDTVLFHDVPTLRYGRTWRRGGITCVSRSVGLTCRNADARGFFLSRERWRLL
jgi:hypothetical protein